MPFLELLTACLLGWAAASPRSVRVQPKFTRSLRTVSPRFLSVALDASLLRTDSLDLLRSQKLITLAKGLSPGYLRFGGTGADFVLFEPSDQLSLPQEHGWESSRIEGTCLNTIPDDVEKYLTHLLALQAPVILKEQFQQDFKNITISERSVDILYSFANCSGLHLIFGLNALLRKKQAWDSSNAQKLLQYCAMRKYNMSWELGNEPNSFRKKAHIKIHGSQLGQDFEHLYNLLHTFKSFNHSGLYGPDIGQPGRQAIVTLLKGFLKTGGNVLSAITWHHYYLNGRTASLKDFLNPQVLDSLILKINQIFEIASKIAPEKKVWLGETSSAFGGGAPDLSDTYVAGFMWLDKLGLSAKLGIDVVIRQALFGAGFYQLVDRTLDPLPDYWLSLIYKRLVGTRVLNVSAVHKDTADNGTLRVYMHCTNPNSYIYRKGSVTMFALNLSDQDKHILLCCSLFNKTIQYLLQPGDSRKGLYSQSVQLNGKLLKMVDRKTLPIITGKVLQPGKPIVLPALSYAFYVVQDAKAPACQ
ncbi:heparanase isoform X1 [Chiloscyllium plagiosum]|uniref:heparanase isoform X1 n=1 Tax=Chiloscyllium plagiosum TaxID=36176 RepID=UPI001CB7C6F1|nr:heparanase isoform X1 [Chiloscyllium plagiosum]